ncbi:MAG TPA: PQQ-binding-like beta-propeller repeat protein [Sphingomonas sp.]|nr:PQQ-binding-like beta-propeller repeat protein [Sphingomonas sp.]
MKKSVKASVAVAALMALSACGIFKGSGKKTPVLGNRVPILVSENDIKPDPSLANVQVLLPDPVPNTEWTQSGGNAAKSMGHLALGDSVTRAWTARIAGGSKRERLAAAPVVADGHLYVMDTNAVVHSFDAATGAAGWSTGIAKSDQNQNARFGGGVSYDGGKLYATDGLGDVVALNAKDGSEIWRVRPGGPLRGAPTLANGQIYALSQDNQLYALSQTDGKVLWTASGSLESQGVFGVAAPAAAQGTVVAGFSSGELNAYRYENGRSLWGDALSRTAISTSVSSLADIDADPVIDQGQVYAVGQGGRMVALEIVTGQRLWEQDFAGLSTPWVAGEWVFVVTDDAKLVCIARGSGKIRWISQLRGFKNVKKHKDAIYWSGPVLAGNKLVLVNSRGEIVFASPQDGSVQRTIETKSSFSLPPVVAENTLYLLDHDGQVMAYR